MTIKELKKIISSLPEDAILITEEDDVKTIVFEYHDDGRMCLLFSEVE